MTRGRPLRLKEHQKGQCLLLRKNGWTQKRIAEHLGMSRFAVQVALGSVRLAEKKPPRKRVVGAERFPPAYRRLHLLRLEVESIYHEREMRRLEESRREAVGEARPCRVCGRGAAPKGQTRCYPCRRMGRGEAVAAAFEKLKTCEQAVFDGGRPDYTSACGEPAVYRVSWDGGQNWLCLCESHAREVEAAEEEVDGSPP